MTDESDLLRAVYYNEFDPKAAAWIRQLQADGRVAIGEVDERSIEDVLPDDLRRFDRCHFFAGIAGWEYALQLAGWPAGRKVWTGSCPCQPFSVSGKGKGFADERHLWPAWFHLINQLRPDTIFGEQVADGGGIEWFDLVSADMEGIGYRVGMAVLPACGFGSPHRRYRTFFVADANRAGQRDGCRPIRGEQRHDLDGRVPHDRHRQPGPTNGVWRDADWLRCRDGKWRAVRPGSFPLATGLPARVGRIRGYGNAIVPQVAAAFIRAYLGNE